MKLFEPAKIGNLSLKNRVVMLPMGTQLHDPDASLTQRAIDFYEARARGGVGLIISAMWGATRDVDMARAKAVYVADTDQCLDNLSKLAQAVHSHGARIALQVTAGVGRVARPSWLANGFDAVAPSEQPCFADPRLTARELTIEEIEGIVEGFGDTAKRARQAGVDAIELHGHCGYLIDQFMTAIWNRRTDRYGGSLEARLRFPIEIVESIKRNAGRDFPVIFRLSLMHYFDGGRELDESLEIIRHMKEAGVDAINASDSCYDSPRTRHYPTYDPPGAWVNLAESVRKAIDIPTIAVGKLGYPELAERILHEEKADFIGLARNLLADPEWPNKAREGRSQDIVPCIGCNDCLRTLSRGNSIACAVNPAAGKERQFSVSRSDRKKKILVVGGGPSGLEAARVAALRGHEVTLWEKGEALGGSLLPTSVPDFKQDFKYLRTYLSKQVSDLGVKIELSTEGTPERIQAMKPEVLIIATGANAEVPEIPGITKDSVVMAFDVLLGKKEVGKDVIVVGGGLVGCELAAHLSQKGKRVTVLEPGEALLPDEFEYNRKDLLLVLRNFGAKLLTQTQVVEIDDNGVVISDSSGQSHLKGDTVVLALGLRPNASLLKSLEGKPIEVVPVGDCVVPRKKTKALIWSGFHAARAI